MRNPVVNPKPGDVLRDKDGMPMRVVKRTPTCVYFTAQPANVQVKGRRFRLATFSKLCSGEIIQEAKA